MSNGGDIAATVRRLEQDVWHGDNRKAGLTTRMQQAEDCDAVAEARMNAQDKRMDGQDAKQWAIILLVVTCLGGIVAELIKH